MAGHFSMVGVKCRTVQNCSTPLTFRNPGFLARKVHTTNKFEIAAFFGGDGGHLEFPIIYFDICLNSILLVFKMTIPFLVVIPTYHQDSITHTQ